MWNFPRIELDPQSGRYYIQDPIISGVEGRRYLKPDIEGTYGGQERGYGTGQRSGFHSRQAADEIAYRRLARRTDPTSAQQRERLLRRIDRRNAALEAQAELHRRTTTGEMVRQTRWERDYDYPPPNPLRDPNGVEQTLTPDGRIITTYRVAGGERTPLRQGRYIEPPDLQGGRPIINADTFNEVLSDFVAGRTAQTPDNIVGMLDQFDKLGPEIFSPEQLQALYDWYAQIPPDLRREIGGYVTGRNLAGEDPVVLGHGTETLEAAIHARLDLTGGKILEINRQIAAHQDKLDELGRDVTPSTPDYVRAEIQKTWNRINSLLQNAKAEQREFFSAQYNLYRLRGDDEFDPRHAADISGARPIHSLFDDPARPAALEREFEEKKRQIRAMYGDFGLYPGRPDMPIVKEEIQDYLVSGDQNRYVAITEALRNVEKARVESIDRHDKHLADMAHAQRNIFDLRAAGAFPLEGPGAPMRITSGEYRGHSVEFLGVENPNTVITPGGWHMPADYMGEVTGTPKDFIPNIGLRYRPDNLTRSDLLSRIGARVIPDSGGETPILRAFETSAASPDLLKAARQDQLDWLWRSKQPTTSQDTSADVLLQEAISRVDRRYSEAISDRIAKGARKLRDAGRLTDAPYIGRDNRLKMAAVVDPILGRSLRKAQAELARRTQPRYLDDFVKSLRGSATKPPEDPGSLQRRYRSPEPMGPYLDEVLTPDKLIDHMTLAHIDDAKQAVTAAERALENVPLDPEAVAREMIAGLMYTERGRGTYSSAYMSLFRQRDEFTGQVRAVLESVIPELRNERMRRHEEGEPNMVERFINMLNDHAGDLGVDPRQRRHGVIMQERAILRERGAQVGLDIEIPTSELMREELGEGERAERLIERYEVNRGDLMNPFRSPDLPYGGGAITEVIDEAAATEADTIRRAVQSLSNLQLQAEAAEWRASQIPGNDALRTAAREARSAVNAERAYFRTKYRPRVRQAIEDLYQLSYNTMVTARLNIVKARVTGQSNAEYITGLSEAIARESAERGDVWTKMMQEQRTFLQRLTDVNAGRFQGLTEPQFIRRHLAGIQNPNLIRGIGMRSLPRLAEQMLVNVPEELSELGIRQLPQFTDQGAKAAVDILADIHNWDPMRRSVFENMLKGTMQNVSPFYGGSPGAVFEHLNYLYQENAKLALEVPKFQENYHKLYSAGRTPIDKVPKELEVRIAGLRQIALSPEQSPDARNLAITFHVLGAHGSEENQAMTMAALHYDKYVASLKLKSPRLSPTSMLGRNQILEMARNELKGGGPIAFTQQTTYRAMGITPNLSIHSREEAMRIIGEVNTLSVKKHGSPIYQPNYMQSLDQLDDEQLKDDARSAWAIYLERGRDERLRLLREATDNAGEDELEELAQYFETANIGQIGGQEFTANTGALDVVERARSIGFMSDEAVNVGVRNTVTTERNIRNQAAARMAVLWRRAKNVGSGTPAQAHGMMITDSRVKPINPITNARIDDIWDDLIPDINKELEQYGLNWDIVNAISESFNGIRSGRSGVNAINLGSWTTLPDDVRKNARDLLGMRTKDIRGATQNENYFYSPLAAGRPMHVPEGHPQMRVYDAFAELLWRKHMSDDELEYFAESTLGKDAGVAHILRIQNAETVEEAAVHKANLLDEIAKTGFDFRPEKMTQAIGRHIATNMYSLLQPDVVQGILGREENASVKEAIWDNIISPMFPFQGERKARTAFEEAERAAKEARERAKGTSVKDIYQRMNFKNIRDAWQREPMLRHVTYGAAAIGALAVIGSRRRKDHTEEDMAGETNGYDPQPRPRGGFNYIDNNYQVPSYQPGVVYQVNANGNYDPAALQQQMANLTGGPVNGTIRNRTGPYNPNDNARKIQEAYG